MAASSQAGGRRRRPRRGSLQRPVDGRLYRTSFLVLSLPLLLAAFTVIRPAPLQPPLLPPAFDAKATLALAQELATQYPDRRPGSAGAVGAAQWFHDQLESYGLPARTDAWSETVPGLGRVRLRNLIATAPGKSPDTIVVMAHRDDIGGGPGADDNASGTAALIELARTYARPASVAQAAVSSMHTLVFVSTDGGAFGGLGALRFAREAAAHGRVVAVIDLDALGGDGPPHVQIAGSRPRSPAVSLAATAAQRLLEQSGRWPRHPGFLGQLIDLGFPLTLYEQGPFVARGIPAVTVTTSGDRPPPAFGDTVSRLNRTRLAELGRAAEQLVGSLDQGLELTHGTTSYVWVGNRMIRGWAIELILVALLVPFLVAVVDLFAFCRRRRIPLGPAARALRSRLAFWLFVGLAFWVFSLLGAWPTGAPVPPDPRTPAAGDWAVLALLAFLAVAAAGWWIARQRLVPRRTPTAEEDIACHAVALIGLAIVALLIVATNPFALLFALPALHVWLWLPLVGRARRGARLGVFAAGLIGPAIVLVSLATRYGLGFDAPWYLLELVSVGYVGAVPVAIVLAGAAPACQLAAAAAGRYAPYPAAEERGPRGPVRELVRTVALGLGVRRRTIAPGRRATGG